MLLLPSSRPRARLHVDVCSDIRKQLLGARLLALHTKLVVIADPLCRRGTKTVLSQLWESPCDFRGTLKIGLESLSGDDERHLVREKLRDGWTAWLARTSRVVFPSFRKAGFSNGDMICSRGE